MSIFLGIDPSVKSTGFAIVNSVGDLIEKDTILVPDPKNNDPFAMQKNIHFQYKEIERLVKEFKVTHLSCEDQFFSNNIDTLKKLVQIRTICLFVATEYHCTPELFYPTAWRKLFHGDGKVKKRDTVLKVNEMFGLKLRLSKDNDIADAIGIAMAHRIKVRNEEAAS